MSWIGIPRGFVLTRYRTAAASNPVIRPAMTSVPLEFAFTPHLLYTTSTIICECELLFKLAIIISMSSLYTRKGDDGYTNLLGEGRVPKHHPQPAANGALDEASSAMGLAKAFSQSERVVEIALQIQRDLYTMMTEIASTPENREKFPQIGHTHIEWLERQIDGFEDEVEIPKVLRMKLKSRRILSSREIREPVHFLILLGRSFDEQSD
jgi:hypothetical protein